MGDTAGAHGWNRVANDSVWRSTRIVFLGSLSVFLVNIGLGFLNVVTTGTIPHWQLVTHLHGATVGWLSLTAVGFAIWQFTGDRAVTRTYERRIRWLAWAAVLVGAGYVASFGVSFSVTGDAYALLPVFGTGTMLVFWATAALVLATLREQPVVRTVHLLLAGAFVVASLGAVMGVLLGLQHAVGSLPLPAGIPSVGNHAGPMDVYAVLLGTAAVEWLVDGDDVTGWSWHGALQAGVFTLAGFLAFVPVEAVSGLGMLVGVLGGSLIFFLRVGWRAVATNPFRRDEAVWRTFAPIWLLVFIALVLGATAVLPDDTAWIGPVAFHAYFVGFITSALFGVYSGRTRDGRLLHEWAEPAAFWLLNLGLLAFAATEIVSGSRHGAIVMGLGVLLAVVVMGYRLTGE